MGNACYAKFWVVSTYPLPIQSQKEMRKTSHIACIIASHTIRSILQLLFFRPTKWVSRLRRDSHASQQPQGSVSSARQPFSHASGSHWHRKKTPQNGNRASLFGLKSAGKCNFYRVENTKKVPFVEGRYPLGRGAIGRRRFAPSHSRFAENLTPSRSLTLASLIFGCCPQFTHPARAPVK